MIGAYLKLEAEKAGKVKGPVRDRDGTKEGSIALLTVEHGIVSPRDAATGMARGKRQHQPISFTKEADGTSPLFAQFIGTNEMLKTVDFFFFGQESPSPLSAGREALLYRISLKKAFVSRLELVGLTDEAAKDANRFPLTERISLVYDQIRWEWTTPKASFDDVFNSTASS